MFNTELKKELRTCKEVIKNYEKSETAYSECFVFLLKELTELYTDKKKAIAKEIEDTQYVYTGPHRIYAYCKSLNKFFSKSRDSLYGTSMTYSTPQYLNIFRLKQIVEERTGGWQEVSSIPTDIATSILEKVKCE